MTNTGGLGNVDRSRSGAAVRRGLRRLATATDPTAGRPLDDLDELPATRRRIPTPDGAELAVVDHEPVVAPTPAASPERQAEPGPATFVLVHCWTGDRRVWGPVARRLVGSGHRVVRYDHRGHGESTLGTAPLSLATLADDLALVLSQTDVPDTTVLAGHSMGGIAIQALAGRRPELLDQRAGAVVLAATSCAPVVTGARRRYGPQLVGGRRVERLLGGDVLGPWSVRSFVGRAACLAHLQAVTETFVATPGVVRTELLRAMATMDLRPGLANLSMPVTVMVGRRDRHTPRSQAHRIAAAVPGSKLVEVPDAGHMLPFEAPDLLAQELLTAAHAARLVTPTHSAPAGERSAT